MFYAFTEDGTGRMYEVSDKAVPNFQQAEGWKVNVPFCYDGGQVTMRLYLSTDIDVELLPNPPCQIFKVLMLRLIPDDAVQFYGPAAGNFLSLEVPTPASPGVAFGEVTVFFTVDLPLNVASPGGLGGSDTLAPGQLLSFGMEWQGPGGNCPGSASAYVIYGVEFFTGGAVPLSGATIVPSAECDCSQ